MALSAKLGPAHQHLVDNFSSVPDGELKIGHVLLLYVENERSACRTIEAVTAKLGVPCTSLKNQLRVLVDKTLGKYKHLANTYEMMTFIKICNEVFTVSKVGDTNTTQTLHEPVASTSTEDAPATSSVEATTIPATPSINSALRGEQVTPRKAMMRKRLAFMSKSISDIKQKHRSTLKDIRKKVPQPNRVKHLNQVIKRKMVTIAKLKKQ